MRKIIIIILGIGLVLGIGIGGYLIYQALTDEAAPEGERIARENGEDGFRGLQPAREADREIINPSGDDDNDGLSNEEEAVWKTDPANPDTDGDGYLDGEEVAANHDPTKPAPDDRLSAEALPREIAPDPLAPVQVERYLVEDLDLNLGDENFTAEFEAQLPAELHSPTSMTQFSDRKQIVNLLPRPQDSEIPNPYNDSLAALAKFLEVADNSALLTDSISYNQAQLDLQAKDDASGILGLAESFRQYRESLVTVPVPAAAVNTHMLLLAYSEAIAATLDQIALWPEDPVKSMTASRQLYVLDRTYFPIIGGEIKRLRQLEAQLAAIGV